MNVAIKTYVHVFDERLAKFAVDYDEKGTITTSPTTNLAMPLLLLVLTSLP